MKKFKMPSAYTILFAIIIVVAILTWVFPAGSYVDGVYQPTDANPQGIYNVLAAPVAGFFDAIDIAVFVMVIGGFLAITMKTGAITSGVKGVIQKLKGRETILIPILMILFGIGGTTFGMAEETIAFYPILLPIFLGAGFDAIVAVAVILGGSGLGVLASTVNPFATGTASAAAEVALGDGILLRVIFLIAMEAIGIFFVMRYAKRCKEDPRRSLLFGETEEGFHLAEESPETDTMNRRKNIILIIFGLTFLIMILGVIPWSYKFNINVFDNAYNFLAEKVRVLGFEPNTVDAYWDHYDASKTHSAALGDWWFGQMSVLFFISALVIGKIAGMKEKELSATFVEGMKDLLGVSCVIGISRGVYIVMSAGKIDATILYWGEQALRGMSPTLFAVMSYLFYLPMSFLIPSTSGLATVSMPIMGPLAASVFQGGGLDPVLGKTIVITAYQAAEGIVNLITPTSGIVMGGLALAGVPYSKWLKFLGKTLLAVFVVTILLLVLGTLLQLP